ncbi:MAG: hypothetical protein FWH32_02170 [Clostridiales bacterium]|nr:hypothetical protein [Clostridiales bacterium]
MNNSVRTVIKLNLRHITGAYIATIAGIAVLASSYIINHFHALQGEYMGGNIGVSIGWALWCLPVAAAIAIPARHFRRIASLGGKRDSFNKGSLLTYVILAAAASLVGTIVYYIEGAYVSASALYAGVYTVPVSFGWYLHGPIGIFFQQFAFLFLTALFIHAFVAMQGKWYGWAMTVGLIAVVSVFLPIATLRELVVGYFYIIIYNPITILQIAACIAIGLLFYALSKVVFARKAI